MSVLSKQFYVVLDNKGRYVRRENNTSIHSESLLPMHIHMNKGKAMEVAELLNAFQFEGITKNQPYTVHPVTVTLGGTQQ